MMTDHRETGIVLRDKKETALRFLFFAVLCRLIIISDDPAIMQKSI